MSLMIRKPVPLSYTHVRVFRDTHAQLLELAKQEGTSLPRLVEALLDYYVEDQDLARRFVAIKEQG